MQKSMVIETHVRKKKKLNPLFEEYIKKCKKKNLIVSIPSEDDGIKETCF